MRTFESLTEREILALAIASEEEDARIYGDFEDGLKESYPASAEMFRKMREEEDRHRHRLVELYRQKFGEHIPHIRREDVKGFVRRRPVWLVRPLGLDTVRQQAGLMELETRRFYERAAAKTSDASIRQLLGDLANEERGHENLAETLETRHTTLGGLGHTLPYLIGNFQLATVLAVAVVLAELIAISWIRHRYMDTPWLSATVQVMLGGTLVFLAGMLIGTS